MSEIGFCNESERDYAMQGVVSEVLTGARKINVRRAKALAHRFGVSPVIFL